MNIEEIRIFCLSFKGVTEEMPFGPTTAVYKVMGKIFLFLPLDTETQSIAVKNTPEKNVELRADYDAITGAFHLNKLHWSSIRLESNIKSDLVRELITESYEIVKKGLTKKLKADLEAL
ncbi:MmcQ/YjbR family DNA-binding protein [Lacihabitans lacunae]|uniref:MmcQ/YjbR family DNA-binding protein n=1 Tax=Lacihabitans lacunae TaxID=1028214 RepID=A0ABV7YS34_9BACT